MDIEESIKLFKETATAIKQAISNFKKDSQDTKSKPGYYSRKLEYFQVLRDDIFKFYNEICTLDKEKKHAIHRTDVGNNKTPEEFLIDTQTHLELLKTLVTTVSVENSPSSIPNASTFSSLAKNIVANISNKSDAKSSQNTEINKDDEISNLLYLNDDLKQKYIDISKENEKIMAQLRDLQSINSQLRIENQKAKLENLFLKSENENEIRISPQFNSSLMSNTPHVKRVSDILKLIPKFNGKPEELRVYINKIDDLFSYINNGDEAIFVTVVKTNLTGEAALEVLDEEGLDSWSELKAKLLTSFKNQENHVNDIALLQQMKQSENESVETFCNRIKKVLSKLKSVIPVGAARSFWFTHTERYALQCLEDGLIDVTVQARLIAQKPPNFQSAVQFAIDTDNRLKKNTDYSLNKTNEQKNKLFCRYCKKTNHTIENCKLKSKKPDQKTEENKTEDYKCTICKKNTHSTDICYNNPKNKQKSSKNEANANSLASKEQNDDELELWTGSEN